MKPLSWEQGRLLGSFVRVMDSMNEMNVYVKCGSYSNLVKRDPGEEVGHIDERERLKRFSHLAGQFMQLGSLRNHDGYGDENVTSKYMFELF